MHPLVVYLDNDSIASSGCPVPSTGWKRAGAGHPVRGHAARRRARGDGPAVQRRIDLLAIEQNAWRLAARDTRCVVVASRTEIDWAMKQGQMIVWAPSKLILDSTDSPDCSPARRRGAGVVAGRAHGGRPISGPGGAGTCRRAAT